MIKSLLFYTSIAGNYYLVEYLQNNEKHNMSPLLRSKHSSMINKRFILSAMLIISI